MFGALILIICFHYKHFVCDFPLQTTYMLGKFKKTGWELPLAAHAGVHAIGTWILSSLFLWHSGGKILMVIPVFTAIIDFSIHFVMDRIKASPEMLGRFKALSAREFPAATEEEKRDNKFFWWALGFDQLIHSFTDVLIVWILTGCVWGF